MRKSFGMALVPEQVEADAEVIGFWQKNPSISEEEIAALVAGVNPLAYKKHKKYIRVIHGDAEEVLISTEKLALIADILTVLEQRLDPLEGHKDIREWRRCFFDNALPFPESLIGHVPNSKSIDRRETEQS